MLAAVARPGPGCGSVAPRGSVEVATVVIPVPWAAGAARSARSVGSRAARSAGSTRSPRSVGSRAARSAGTTRSVHGSAGPPGPWPPGCRQAHLVRPVLGRPVRPVRGPRVRRVRVRVLPDDLARAVRARRDRPGRGNAQLPARRGCRRAHQERRWQNRHPCPSLPPRGRRRWWPPPSVASVS